MNIEIAPGTYVVAVSGGVDSMVLLDLLRQQPDVRLIVAHYDHGIRPDSSVDRELVQGVARKHGLSFVYDTGKLGVGVSEETARKARYEFLHKVRQATNAQAIITAHHHDDVMETAVHNLLRGTNRKGLSALQSRQTIQRPLLNIEKQLLHQYAQDQGLLWREDSTNQDTRYARNYIRHRLMNQFSQRDKQKLKDILARAADINTELDTQLMHYLHIQPASDKLDKLTFLRLPHVVAREVMASWLRKHDLGSFDQKTLERLVISAKTFGPGKTINVMQHNSIKVTKQYLALERSNR